MTTLLAAPDTNELEALAALPLESAPQRAARFLGRVVNNPTFLATHILPLLEEVRRTKEWYVAHRYDAQDGSYSLQIFFWPPGSKTHIHDHTSWGAYCCVVGCVLEERYERLDDGLRLNHARLKKVWQLYWSREDGASSVLPHDGGIHRVGNPSESPAISVHLYGPQIGEVDGRDYDPSRDYVCDRVETRGLPS